MTGSYLMIPDSVSTVGVPTLGTDSLGTDISCLDRRVPAPRPVLLGFSRLVNVDNIINVDLGVDVELNVDIHVPYLI